MARLLLDLLRNDCYYTYLAILKVKLMPNIGTPIEFSITDLEIRKTTNGKEFLSIKSNVAFNNKVVEMSRDMGIEDAYVTPEEDEE